MNAVKNRRLKVFLCHAHSDATLVRDLFRYLMMDGVDAWLDKEKLLPGADWELEIRKAVRESDAVVVCLSKQFNQAGFRQKEVRLALETAMEKPEGEIFIIPARLEECDTLESLRRWQWVNLFIESGYEDLMRTLRVRAEKIGAELPDKNSSLTVRKSKSKRMVSKANEILTTKTLAIKQETKPRLATKSNDPVKRRLKHGKIRTSTLKVFCPFCLTIHDFGDPPVCVGLLDENGRHPDVPRSYIENYDRSQPLWLAAVGFSGHGRTSYIGSLTSLLDNVDRLWDGSVTAYLDNYTNQKVRVAQNSIYGPKGYDKTRKWGDAADNSIHSLNAVQSFLRPLLIRIYAIPKFRSRCLVLYDLAGEELGRLGGIQEGAQSDYFKSLKAIRTIWFVVSLTDLANYRSGRLGLQDLLNVFITSMEKIGWGNIRNRNLIVVYTKADKLQHIEHVPPSVIEYLLSDGYGQLISKTSDDNLSTFFQGVEREDFDLDKYFSEMERISSELESYTKKLPGGSAFLNIAKDNGLKIYFTVTSALGSDFQNGESIVGPTSYRVLDPLLWAMKLDSKPPIPTTIKIILDPYIREENNQVYSLPFDILVRELRKIGDDVVTYYLGRKRPCAPDEPPNIHPRHSYPRLLRPLLFGDNSNTLAIVFTNGPIEDFDDFLDTDSDLNKSWADNLFIVSLSKDYEPPWRWSVNFLPGDPLELVINQFKRMLQDAK